MDPSSLWREPNPHERLILKKKLLRLIFPVEVWLLIFEKLSVSAKTMQNCANSSLILRQWLHTNGGNNLATNMFSLVFPFLVKHLNLQNPKCTETKQRSCLIIQNCRLMCRSWSSGVDQYFQNPSTHHVRAIETFDWTTRAPSNTALWQALLNPNGFEVNWPQFVSHFASTHEKSSRSPFLGRSMLLHLNNMNHGTCKMLELYGKHVWHCGLVYRSFRYLHELWEILQQVLLNLPNLRTLSIFCLDRRLLTKMPATQRAAEIVQTSLPNLKFLVSIRLQYVPCQLIEELLNSNAESLNFVLIRHIGPPHHVSSKLPFLKFLLLNIQDETELNMLKQTTNLETLAVKMQKSTGSWTFSKILQMAEINLPETVRTLLLYLPTLTPRELTVKTRLHIPLIQKLKIHTQNWISLDFILPAAVSLEVLCISVQTEPFEKWMTSKFAKILLKTEVIKFLQFHKDVSLSIIWQLFPRLKLLKVCYYTPEENRVLAWERVKQNRQCISYVKANDAEEFK